MFLIAPLVQVFLRQAFGRIEILEFPHLLDVFGEGCPEFLFGSLDHSPMLEGLQKKPTTNEPKRPRMSRNAGDSSNK